jgi:hypothetical protein
MIGEELTADLSAGGGWLKSTFSTGSCTCVEVRFEENGVSIRDSKYRRDPNHDLALEPVIAISDPTWETFLSEVRGDMPAGANGALGMEHSADGTVTLRSLAEDTALVYTPEEWSAFVAGVKANQFSLLLSPA